MLPMLQDTARFLRSRALACLAVSLLILVPCFWHTRLEAGDLPSHVYNAWLANLVERGAAPGLYIAQQTGNILVDVLLSALGSRFGFPIAERVVVSFCVLVFFWGSFAATAATSKRAPWPLVPAFALAAYGYTFEMGFLNFYLSVGFALFALAIAYHGSEWEWLGTLPLAVLAWMAHPVGFVLLVGIGAYAMLARKLSGRLRQWLFAAALLAVVAAHFYVFRYRTDLWSPFTFFLRNGADQIALFGKRYTALFLALSAFLLIALVQGFYVERRTDLWPRIRVAAELWLTLLFTVALLPQTIYLPQYPAPAAFFVSRITCLSLVLILCVLSAVRQRLWHTVGLVLCAVIFFGFLYQDTGRLNNMEAQAETLAGILPYGARVIATVGPATGSRMLFIGHLVDRACVNHCFIYSDYEPSTEQFRLRVRPGSPIAAASAKAVTDMANGQYVVQPADLPLHEIYQCSANIPNKLCIRELKAGVPNCGNCASPAKPTP